MADTGLLRGGPCDGWQVRVQSVVATVETFAGPYRICSIDPLTYEWRGTMPSSDEVQS